MPKLTPQQQMELHENDTRRYLNREVRYAIERTFVLIAVERAYARIARKQSKHSKKRNGQ